MSIEQLLRPRSIAIVGASDRIGPGFNAWNALQFVGYEGEIYLVNPGKPELFGQRTYPSLAELPGLIDAAFLAVGADNVFDAAHQSVAKGAGALAILASGFGEAGEAGITAERKLVALGHQHSLAVCGPNCLGLLNFGGRSALFGTSLPENVERGGIAAIVQSGSIGIALLNSARGLGLSYLITTGNEAVTTAADYLDALIEDPSVTTIIVFAEQIKKPKKFVEVLHRAQAAGKPVIVLKSGRSERGQAAVLAHTGAVAGSREAADAALRAAGAIQVETLDELVETAALVSQIRIRPTGRRIGAVSLSGGEIALVLDAAESVGADFASVGSAKAQIEELLPKFAHVANPLDLTWAGLYDPEVARGCARALCEQDDVGVLALIQDAPHGLGPQQAARYSALLTSVAKGAEDAGKPLVAISNLAGEPHPVLATAAHDAHVPYLRGTREGLSALARFGRWAMHESAPASAIPHNGFARAHSLFNDLPKRRMPGEHEARKILASYGISGPREHVVQTAQEAARAAADIGFPVVLKCIISGMVHKSDAGMVSVGLRSVDDVLQAASGMLRKAAELNQGSVLALLVQEKAAPIAELFLGARVDPEFGPLVAVGAGGVLVELYHDVAVRIAPIGEAAALEALESTKISRTLDGWRAAPRADKSAAAQIISAVSHFIADFGADVSEVEINPLAIFAEGHGCSALDCVIIPQPVAS